MKIWDRPAAGSRRHILSIDTIVIISSWNTRKWHERGCYCYCDSTDAATASIVAHPYWVRGHRQYITWAAGVCVWESAAALNRYFHFYFLLRFVRSFLVGPYPPSIQLQTNGRNVSIARATMTTHGFIILWCHKYVMCACDCVCVCVLGRASI